MKLIKSLFWTIQGKCYLHGEELRDSVFGKYCAKCLAEAYFSKRKVDPTCESFWMDTEGN